MNRFQVLGLTVSAFCSLMQIIHGILEDDRFAKSLPEVTQSIVRSSYLESFPIIPGKS